MPKNYAYLRVSDKNRQDHETQKDSIMRYANENGIIIDSWTEESVSASKTELSSRKISILVGSLQPGDKLICTEISRLGRDKPFSILGLINDIAEIHQAQLHLTYTDQVIHKDNVEDPEILFGVVGASYAARQEAIKRAERAKAACNRRVSQGLANGRPEGIFVASKLDEQEDFIIRCLNDKQNKSALARDLKCGRSTLIKWLETRDNIKQKAQELELDWKKPISILKMEINEANGLYETTIR
jgi:DNA invertase Pin-like site-specific DNA recombinase|tara:strand:- start:17 stop:745 length:729 start_codon:yes stop_codon:yes gene_type:complete